jgi:hypothetical protein
MNEPPIQNDKRRDERHVQTLHWMLHPETNGEQHVPNSHWWLLVGPPLVTPVVATVWYLLAFAGLGGIGIILYLLTPIVCAVWAFRICRRLADSSIGLLIGLFVLELVLILIAFLLGTPHWD